MAMRHVYDIGSICGHAMCGLLSHAKPRRVVILAHSNPQSLLVNHSSQTTFDHTYCQLSIVELCSAMLSSLLEGPSQGPGTALIPKAWEVVPEAASCTSCIRPVRCQAANGMHRVLYSSVQCCDWDTLCKGNACTWRQRRA